MCARHQRRFCLGGMMFGFGRGALPTTKFDPRTRNQCRRWMTLSSVTKAIAMTHGVGGFSWKQQGTHWKIGF